MIIIDNKLQVAKIRLTYIVTIATGSILVLYSVFSGSNADGKFISLIIGLLLYLVFLYLLIIKPEYIYFAIKDNSKLIVRNYTAFPVFRKFKAYEIALNTVYDFEIKKALFNQIVFIRLMVKTKNKVGKYPWLSLSAVSASDKEKLISTLNKLIPVENRKK